jgi:hypothetical protein
VQFLWKDRACRSSMPPSTIRRQRRTTSKCSSDGRSGSAAAFAGVKPRLRPRAQLLLLLLLILLLTAAPWRGGPARRARALAITLGRTMPHRLGVLRPRKSRGCGGCPTNAPHRRTSVASPPRLIQAQVSRAEADR